MPRIADVLERESRTVDLEQGEFERLLGRRERKERNRRIRAGAVGVIVALATGIMLVRALTSDGIPANPPVEPTPAPPVLSGALAYVLDGETYVAGPDGSNAVRIADVGAIDDECPGDVFTTLPSWSPDGRYLAFRRFAECFTPAHRDVVIADLHGNVVGTFRARGYRVAWSPDSTRVAVWDEYPSDEAGAGTIGIYGIDGTRETQIAMPIGWEVSDQRDPIWTPDGASLIVSQLEVPLDGGSPRELPFPELFRTRSGGWWVPALAYSPDGSQVAYGTRQATMIARSDGSEPRELLGEAANTATWSPTGEQIAVASHTPEGATAPNGTPTPNHLRVVDVTTGSATLLYEGEPGTWLNVIGFSPDGDRVVFGEQRPVLGQPEGTYLYSLWSIGVDGSDARQIVVGTNDAVLGPR
jgi:Tol biopolymer transport system component